MSQTLKPGLYHIRAVDIDHLPPGPGGKYATSKGQGNPVKVEPVRPPFPDKQIFNVVADPEVEASYEILVWNSPTVAVPGWDFADSGVGPITINSPKKFHIESVESVDCEGIYRIRVSTRMIDSEVRVGVDEDDDNVILMAFRLGHGQLQRGPVWQFVPFNPAE